MSLSQNNGIGNFQNKINTSPIGIFDSGVGGLTVLKAVCKYMPNENVVYFGDTNRVPYGQRSKEEIIKYATQAINFLKSKGAKVILIACGTATSYISYIKDIFGEKIPIFGIIEAASNKAVEATHNGKIGIMCTPVSAKVGLYEKSILKLRQDCKVYTVGCPILAPVIEKGVTDKNYDRIDVAVKLYVDSLTEHNVDTIILGCTHYPIIKDMIKNHAGDDVCLIDPGEAVANLLKSELENLNIETQAFDKGNADFFVSGDTQKFSLSAKHILEMDCVPVVGKIDIEKY